MTVEDTAEVKLPSDIVLEPGEDLVLFVHQHWFVFRDPFLVALFIPIVLLSSNMYLDIFGLGEPLRSIWGTVSIYSAGVSFVYGLAWFMWRFYLWRNTVYLVTNKRLILINQLGLFNKEDRETGLTMIQDVRSRIGGLQAALYGFGEVIVQVSSQDSQLTLEKVGKPREIQQAIIREAHLKPRE